jgi:hypothetical protein
MLDRGQGMEEVDGKEWKTSGTSIWKIDEKRL